MSSHPKFLHLPLKERVKRLMHKYPFYTQAEIAKLARCDQTAVSKIIGNMWVIIIRRNSRWVERGGKHFTQKKAETYWVPKQYAERIVKHKEARILCHTLNRLGV